ncbi:cobalamin B12-binding domain-containing protein [Paenibacillus thalictri]|uniref:Cobalamin B12-binding domain-containing protein n=1 Tax=Paenibacillus thalictri TaxID=2527873 RepID=A0A4Q9DU56_9BACL|nr:cobalamin B12-binding domain-containing protein [Paenibacillus thalictri]
MGNRIKVLIAKPGLDGHTRGALVVAQALTDAGMEVVYSGIRKTPAEIVALAATENVDCIGLSCLSGAHMEHFPEVLRLLHKHKLDIPVLGGGIIPDEDGAELLKAGFSAIFTPGTPLPTIVEYIRRLVRTRNADAASG